MKPDAVALGKAARPGWRTPWTGYSSRPVTTWILYVVLAAAMLAAADVFLKLAAGAIPNSLGMLLYGSVAFLVGLTWFIADFRTIEFTKIPRAAVLSGLGVGLAFSTVTIAMYAAFRAGAPLSVASPVIRLGGLIVASACGALIWREPITIRYVLGIAMAVGGLYLLLHRA